MGLAEKLGILIVELLEETVLSLLSSLRFFIAVPNSDLVSHVFLKEFEGDLGDDALEFPLRVFVQLLDLVGVFGRGFEFRGKRLVQYRDEKGDPGGDFLWLQKIGANIKVVAHVKDFAN